eukprot:COSAG01_NODE_202_length_22130_cov_167.927239_11_plen_156_part_00
MWRSGVGVGKLVTPEKIHRHTPRKSPPNGTPTSTSWAAPAPEEELGEEAAALHRAQAALDASAQRTAGSRAAVAALESQSEVLGGDGGGTPTRPEGRAAPPRHSGRRAPQHFTPQPQPHLRQQQPADPRGAHAALAVLICITEAGGGARARAGGG